MQSLEVGGYTRLQVIDALHAKYKPRNIKFKYDLPNKNEVRKSTLSTVAGGSIAMQYEADIKRTAKFKIEDDETINWLSDRIQPFFMLKMPKQKVLNTINSTFSRNSIAYNADGTQVQAGRFGNGVMVEEGTTNLVPNGNFTNGTTGWINNQNTTLSVIQENNLNLCKCVTNQSTSTPGATKILAVASNNTYTLIKYVSI